MSDIINVKIDPKVKIRAKRIANDLGLTLSGVVNAYLRQFIRSGTLFVSNSFEEPSDFLREAIREAEDDKKKKSHYSFDSASKALDFVDQIIAKKK